MRHRPFFLLLHAAIIVLPIRSASAASATWTGLGADSSWSTNANWSAAPAPNGTADIATFNSSGNGRANVAFATTTTSLGSLKFDTANCAAYTIGGASTTLLLFTDITVTTPSPPIRTSPALRTSARRTTPPSTSATKARAC